MIKRIALGGKMCTGKSSVAQALEASGYKILSFSKPLKKIAEVIASKYNTKEKHVLLDELCKNIWGDTTLGRQTSMYFKIGFLPMDYHDITVKDEITRKLLQDVGDGARKVFGSYIWIDGLLNQLKDGEKFVVDDVRYPAEVNSLKINGFTLVKFTVDDETQRKRIRNLYGDVSEDRLNHYSEVALDGLDDAFHYIIDTSALSLEQQINKIEEVLKCITTQE